MFCPKCGNEIPEGARFCASCGAEVRQAPPAAAATQSAAPNPVPAVPARRRPVRAVVLAVVALLVVALAGFGGYRLFFAPYAIDSSTFPDAAVRQIVLTTLDPDGDGMITREEGAEVTELTISNPHEVSGLGRVFPNLEQLTITSDSDALERVDTGDLSNLKQLTVDGEGPEGIDVSHNDQLTSISVPNETDVSGADAAGLEERWLLVNYSCANAPNNDPAESAVDFSEDRDIVRDDQGRVTSFDGNDVTYDAEGRVSTIELTEEYCGMFDNSGTVDGPVVATFSYNEDGTLARIDCDSGAYNKFTYKDGRMISRLLHSWNASEVLFEYEYDDDGNLVAARQTTGLPDQLGNFRAQGDLLVTTYTYENGRLASRTEGSQTTTFTYDDDGLLASAAHTWDDTVTTTYVYDDEERCTGASANSNQRFQADCAYDEHDCLSKVEIRDYTGWNSLDMTFTYQRYFLPEDAATTQVYDVARNFAYGQTSRSDGPFVLSSSTPFMPLPTDPENFPGLTL